MKLGYRFKTFLQFLAFAFSPITTLIICVLSAFFFAGLFAVAMEKDWIHVNTALYNIFFSLTTGIVGSFLVAFIIELSANYKNNMLAWHELQEYFSAIEEYELSKQVLMEHTPDQRAVKMAREDFVYFGGMAENDEDNRPKDIIQATWQMLPKVMPVLKRTIEDKKAFLNDAEIDELKNIMFYYKVIREAIHARLRKSPVLYNVLNHPDEEFLKGKYPSNILSDIPDWLRRNLAEIEEKRAMDRLVDSILSDSFLLEQYMKDYDISLQALIDYPKTHGEDHENVNAEEINDEENAFSEPEDEEAFRAFHDEMNRKLEDKARQVISGIISKYCNNIAESIDILEKYILKKPYFGFMLALEKELCNLNLLEDPISMQSYDTEIKRLKLCQNKYRKK
ncbi:MAG: hypothetical protein IKX30_12650 [Victivallales bacterium]|nr:hypothetical protein [Victivallales bacterium]